jgi:hypothetical protein
MTHAETVAAVRASELLSPSRAERREESYKVVPGDQRAADAKRRVATRVMPADPRSAGCDGGVGGPTLRAIPGSPRHA